MAKQLPSALLNHHHLADWLDLQHMVISIMNLSGLSNGHLLPVQTKTLWNPMPITVNVT